MLIKTVHMMAKSMRSERGASLSVALLLMLVCIALTAAVLAASTASVGRLANQGETDQRYYAVTSAAELFRDSLGSDDKIKYEFVQKKSSDGTITVLSGSAVGEEDDRSGFSFLDSITRYALFGTQNPAETSYSPTEGSSWVEPFVRANMASGNPKNFTYTITANGAGDEFGEHLIEVGVNARLKNDWTLQLDFYNTKTPSGADASDDKGEVFHIYMSLGADCENVMMPGMEKKRKTVVRWQLLQVVPGRGMPSA